MIRSDIAQKQKPQSLQHESTSSGNPLKAAIGENLQLPEAFPCTMFTSVNSAFVGASGEGLTVPQIPLNFFENFQTQQKSQISDSVPLEKEGSSDNGIAVRTAASGLTLMPNGSIPQVHGHTLVANNPSLMYPCKATLRDPSKAPRGCPQGHWWCKLCIKYMKLNKFNPATKAMQYKYLCSSCEKKTKQDQAEKFKRGRDGNVNPNHPRRVGAKNKVVHSKRDDSLRASDAQLNADLRPNPKKRRRRGRRWSSVEKVLNGFDPNVDWRLVVLGIRNHNVHCSANFQAGRDFASRELLNRFRDWASMLPQQESQFSKFTATAGVAINGTSSKAQIANAPIQSSSRCSQVDTLLEQIHSLNVQQRLISQQMDTCMRTYLQLQRRVQYNPLDINGSRHVASSLVDTNPHRPVIRSDLMATAGRISDPCAPDSKKLTCSSESLSQKLASSSSNYQNSS